MSVHRHCDHCGREGSIVSHSWFVVTKAFGGDKVADFCRRECVRDYFAAEVEKWQAFIDAEVDEMVGPLPPEASDAP